MAKLLGWLSRAHYLFFLRSIFISAATVWLIFFFIFRVVAQSLVWSLLFSSIFLHQVVCAFAVPFFYTVIDLIWLACNIAGLVFYVWYKKISSEVNPWAGQFVLLHAIFCYCLLGELSLLALLRLAFVCDDGFRTLIQPFDILTHFQAGSKQKLGGVNVLFGNSIWRSHFTGETRKLIFARGILGVFFLFGIASFTVIKVLTEPIRELRLISTQTIRTPDSELPIDVQDIPLGVVITKYYDTHPDFKTLGLAVNVHALRNSDTLNPDCAQLTSEDQDSGEYMAIYYQCPSLDTDDFRPDLLVTVNFSTLGIPIDAITEVPKNSVQVMVAKTNRADNVVLMTIPTTLIPGVNLIGLIYTEIYQVFTDPGLSLSGLFDSTQSIIVGQMVNVFQDPQAGISPLIVRSPEIATIRLISQFDNSLWKVTQDSRTKSVLNGLSQAGGLWTFLSGIFAVFFGSSLMHILFDTKPVSIFGIAHSWERKTIQRAYREDYPAIKEEIHVSQDRRGLLCLLQDHILDLNLIEESGSEFRQGFSEVPKEEDHERGLEEPKTRADEVANPMAETL